MVDEIDRANELAYDEQTRLINNHASRHQYLSTGYCVDCGDVIDAKRLAINSCFIRCVDCQIIFEVHRARNV